MTSTHDQTAGIQRYCNSLEEIKLRIKSVQDIVNGKVKTDAFGHGHFVDEFIFVQVRKILELIAFGSMSSNIELYQREYSDYQRQWRAKKILEKLERINPEFYPQPLKPSSEFFEGHFGLEVVNEGYLTKEDFIFLYDASSRVIHSPNPFAEAQKLDLMRSVDDWMHRIASLLWFHQMRLVAGRYSWLVYLIHPETKRSHAIWTVPYEEHSRQKHL